MYSKRFFTVEILTLVLLIVFVAIGFGQEVPKIPTTKIPRELLKLRPYDLEILSSRAESLGDYNFNVLVRIRNSGLGSYSPDDCCQAYVALYTSPTVNGWELNGRSGVEKIPALDKGEMTTIGINLHKPNEGTVVVAIIWDFSPNNDRDFIHFVY